MKIVFISNYFNHHQKPFCEEMYKQLGTDFVFVATAEMGEERKKMGYGESNLPNYVLLAHEGEQQRNEALKLVYDADVVIAGSAPNEFLQNRIRAGKLLFRYSERPFKKKISFLKRIYHYFGFHQRNFWKKNIYMLCSSAYAAKDYASVGMYKGKTYKWGYFPEAKTHDIDELLKNKKKNTLLWCGRFLDWKHPDDAIKVAKKLKENGYDFRLNMIGTGVMEDELKALVKKYDLDDVVQFLGAMPPEQVRSYMEEAGIYLFTSDRQEGWGAVLNESMNSGCAVVASHEIGAVPFLMIDGENGYIYKSKNVEQLYQRVKHFLDSSADQNRMGKAAYTTIVDEWNAKIATCNFLELLQALSPFSESNFVKKSGPCSKAYVIHENWAKESIK